MSRDVLGSLTNECNVRPLQKLLRVVEVAQVWGCAASPTTGHPGCLPLGASAPLDSQPQNLFFSKLGAHSCWGLAWMCAHKCTHSTTGHLAVLNSCPWQVQGNRPGHAWPLGATGRWLGLGFPRNPWSCWAVFSHSFMAGKVCGEEEARGRGIGILGAPAAPGMSSHPGRHWPIPAQARAGDGILGFGEPGAVSGFSRALAQPQPSKPSVGVNQRLD